MAGGSYQCDKDQRSFDAESARNVELDADVRHKSEEACGDTQPSNNLDYRRSVRVGDNDLAHSSFGVKGNVDLQKQNVKALNRSVNDDLLTALTKLNISSNR